MKRCSKNMKLFLDHTPAPSDFLQNKDTDWWIAGVYGPNTFGEGRSFWSELEDLHALCSLNWTLGGDFNIIKNLNESSNSPRLTTYMRRSDEIIRELALFDLPNAQFTWSNGYEVPAFRKLDRFLVFNEELTFLLIWFRKPCLDQFHIIVHYI